MTIQTTPLTASASDIADALITAPMHTFDALAPRAADAPPSMPGFYGLWQTPGALPGIVGAPHPTVELELLYVGIGPQNATSRSNLQKRLAKHHHGAIGSSTFRFTLTAFLWQPKEWKPYWTDRPALGPTDRSSLSTWQREHLRVQWVTTPEPWLIEAKVIQLLKPLLNRDHNESHPAHEVVGAARDALRIEARTRPTTM